MPEILLVLCLGVLLSFIAVKTLRQGISKWREANVCIVSQDSYELASPTSYRLPEPMTRSPKSTDERSPGLSPKSTAIISNATDPTENIPATVAIKG